MRNLNSYFRDIQKCLTCETYERYKDGFCDLPRYLKMSPMVCKMVQDRIISGVVWSV